MAIPKAAVQALVKQLAAELKLTYEKRTTGNPWTDGFFVSNAAGQEIHLVRRVGGRVDAAWCFQEGNECFNNGPPTETQLELKWRLTAILRELL